MANVKITDLTAYTDPLNTDVLAIVDVTNNVTKKVSIANMAKNVSLGTAALPGVAFDGDPNTGIYSPGADQLAVATNGVARLSIGSTGDVDTTKNLFVGSAGGSPEIRIGNGAVATGAGFINIVSSSVFGNWQIASNQYTASALSFVPSTTVGGTTFTTPSVTLAAAGSVGIGTGAAAPGGTLDIKAAASTHPLIVQGPSSEFARIDSSGRLGIGTTSPGSIFHVKPATDENIRFSGGSGDTRIACFNDAASSTVQLSIQASPLLFRGTGGAEVGRWDSSGRLLVGTSSGNANGGILQLSSGITFPATAVAASDVNTLDDYEEGTWTPIDSSGAGLTFTSTTGSYTKIGNLCYVSGSLTFPSTANASSAIIGGLPFNPSAATQYLNYGPPIRNDKSLSMHVFGLQNTTFFLLPIGNYTTYITNLQMSNGTMLFSHTYQTA